MRIPLSQIETFDTTPNKLKFYWRERKNNTRQEIAVEKMYYNTIDLWKECEFFIKDHVGCGFNKTFKEWCKRHKKIENGINIREYFKKQLWDFNAANNIKNRVCEAVLRNTLLKQLDNGAFEPRKLKRKKVKEVLLSFRGNLQENVGSECTKGGVTTFDYI